MGKTYKKQKDVFKNYDRPVLVKFNPDKTILRLHLSGISNEDIVKRLSRKHDILEYEAQKRVCIVLKSCQCEKCKLQLA